MSETNAQGVPLEDAKMVKSAILRTWDHISGELFSSLDDIATRFDLSEKQLDPFIRDLLGHEVADEYRDEWADD